MDISFNRIKKEMYQAEKHIGRNLRLLRHLYCLSQDTVARRLNISRSNYRYYEAGERIPSLDLICDISELYGISLDFLIAFDISEHIMSLLKAGSDRSDPLLFMEKYLKLSHGAKQEIRTRMTELHHDEFGFNNFPWGYDENKGENIK